MNLLPTFERFGQHLAVRLDAGAFTTEDSVRYTLFAALLETTDLRPEEVVLEQPHPHISRAQIDTWIPSSATRRGAALEFKYDREMPSEKNSPRTMKAGKVFHDLFRLGLISQEIERIFIYLASGEMSTYFTNKNNGLTGFFNLAPGKLLPVDEAFIADKAATFRNSVGQPPNVKVESLFSRSLPKSHELRIYGVTNLAPVLDG